MILCCGNVSSYKQDSVWSWFISSCSALCMMLTIGFAFALGVLFPVFMDSFNESRERTAWVSSILLSVPGFLGPVIAAFLNRFGIRISTILGCLSCSAGLAMGSFVHNILLLCIAFSVPFAMGVSVVYVTATITATHYFDKRRSVALGIATAGQGLGTMILGPSVQALVDVLDWRNTFRVFAGILGVTSLTGCFLHQGTSPPNGQKESLPKKFSLNLSLLKNPSVLIMLIEGGVYTFSRIVPYVHIVKHCDDLGISADKSSTLYLFIGIFATVGRLGGGFLSDMKCVKPIRLFQVAAFIVGTSTMLLTVTKTYGALVAYAIVFSLADGIMVTTYIIALLNSVKEALKASTFGFSMMCCGIGAVSSPPLSGLMADKDGNYIAAFLMAGGAGIMSSLIPFLLLCFKRGGHDTEDEELQGRNEDPAERDEDELDPHLKPPFSVMAMESSI